MSVLVKIWSVILGTYVVALLLIACWPIIVNALAGTFEYLDQITGGFATPAFIVLFTTGLTATLFFYTNVLVQTRKEPLALIIAGGTMFKNVFKSRAERRARDEVSQLNPPGVIEIVLFSPSQRDIGEHYREVR